MSRFYDILRGSLAQGATPSPRPAEPEIGRPQASAPEPTSQSPVETMALRFAALQSVHCVVRPEDRLVGCCPNGDFGAEKFRYLRYRLTRLRQKHSLNKVLVTSAIPKEGKTFIATNLALSLARGFPRVLLVDADMRQPGVHRALGLGPLPGLADYLEGRLEIASCLRRVDSLGICYLPAGQASSNPFELLQGPRMREAIKEMGAAFDWIVLDSPPLIPFADAHCLASMADAALLVVRQGLTPKEMVQQGLAALEGAHVAGVVLNASDDTQHDGYYYHYYSRAGDKNEKKKSDPVEEDSPR